MAGEDRAGYRGMSVCLCGELRQGSQEWQGRIEQATEVCLTVW